MAVKLTENTVFALIKSENKFPIDFDDVWRWIGYSRKDSAKRNFLGCQFINDVDYTLHNIVERVKGNHGGGSVFQEKIHLTVECFKMWAMMAGTAKGKEVRRYFLDCERRLKEILEQQHQQQQENGQKRLVAAMISEKAISRYPKFDDEFYKLLYQKRGDGWESRSPKNRPPCVGQWTNHTVYDRLLGGTEPGGVKEKLNEVNPRVEGQRKHRHHWHLKELGEYHLNTHLEAVKALARVSPDGDWDKFMYNIAKGLPNGEPLQLNLLDILEHMEQAKNLD